VRNLAPAAITPILIIKKCFVMGINIVFSNDAMLARPTIVSAISEPQTFV